MATLEINTENKVIAKCLKKISGTKWVGNTIHTNLESCLTAINLQTFNSGWYKPKAIRVNGLTGIYMLNENGTIYADARVIKKDENIFLIEYLCSSGTYEFEKLYNDFIEEN